MKLILLFATIALLQTQGAFSFLYQKENRYSDILKRYSDISQPEVSGLNLKITDESLNGLVDKLVAQLTDEDEEVDRSLFEFEDNDEFDGFEDVDMTSLNTEVEKGETFPRADNIVVTSDFGKWGCVYSRVFSISSNGTKSFWKVHDTSKQGGKVTSNVQGSLDTQLSTQSQGKVAGGVNTTVYHEGKEYKSRIGFNTVLNATEVEKKAGKSDQRIITTSNSAFQTNLRIANKTVPFGVTVSSKAETFVAPFRIYLTLFESDWALDASSYSKSNKIAGKVRGEVTSRVIFAKNGKSLTKAFIKGYVTVEGDQICSVKMFGIKSHIWTKTVSSEESNEFDEVDGNGTTIYVGTASRGRVYERAETTKKTKLFSGSGVASYEKTRVTVPQTVAEHEYGVHWMIKNLMDRKLANWGKPSADMLAF